MSAGGKANGLSFDHVLNKLQVRSFVWLRSLPGGVAEKQRDWRRVAESHHRYE